MTNTLWKLQTEIAMDHKVAGDVAKVACALMSLSLAWDNEDAPEELQTVVDEGLEAMERIFA